MDNIAEMVRLETVRVEDFASQQGTVFHLRWEAVDIPLMLAEATRSGRSDANGRPFSLRFSGPPLPALPQQIYRLSHEALGVMEIFLVPVSGDADQRCYEAVFG